MSSDVPSTKLLSQFHPLDRLPETQLILLANKVEQRNYEPQKNILEIGSEDQLSYFLVSGTVKLESFDGRVKEINAQSETAKSAIASLQPRRYKVTALDECTFIVVQQSIIQALMDELPKNKSIEFSAADVHSGHEIEDIEATFIDDLKTNNIELPSFPEVAFKIRNLLDDPDVSAADVANALTNDPAITVKLIKTCNSALYRTSTEITSSQDAIVRLGFATTRRLVNIFAMKELFSSKNQALQAKMSSLWSESREVATIAYVLADITPKMNPELAMLAGLVQNIGVVPILQHLNNYPQFMKIENKVDDVISNLKAKIGSQLLAGWGFQDALIKVAENSENWLYQSEGDAADYVDIVVVAQIHALIGKGEHQGLPKFSDIPAFKKLGENGLTPEQSQKVLVESHHRIADLKALLTMDGIPVLN